MPVSTNEYTQRYNPEEQDRHSGLDTDLRTDSEITVSYRTYRVDEDWVRRKQSTDTEQQRKDHKLRNPERDSNVRVNRFTAGVIH
jgi:hypothetical protein